MKIQTNIEFFVRFLIITCLASFVVGPGKASAVWCQDWQEYKREVTVLDTKEVSWNGETLSLRYWDEVGQSGSLEFVYWTIAGEKITPEDPFRSFFSTPSYSSSWSSFSINLRYYPAIYQLNRIDEYCIKVREPTLWERISN